MDDGNLYRANMSKVVVNGMQNSHYNLHSRSGSYPYIGVGIWRMFQILTSNPFMTRVFVYTDRGGIWRNGVNTGASYTGDVISVCNG